MGGHNPNDEQVDIFHIARRGKIDLYKQNIDKFDINIRNEYGESLLHEAIAFKQTEIALDLLERGIDVNIREKKRGQTVLHYIGYHLNTILAEKIIEKGGSLEIKDAYGNAPLWYAVFFAKGNYELVELFMKYHPDPTSKNKAGRSPIDFAMQIKDEALLNILRGRT
jgi:ankyrin repeat protein